MATSVKLLSSDGEVFQVDVEIAQKSITIKTMLEDLGLTEEDNDIPVPLPNVNAAILEKVANQIEGKTPEQIRNTFKKENSEHQCSAL